MKILDSLDITAQDGKLAIDWSITPAMTFTIFESWGTGSRIFSSKERYYYFYVDGWDAPAKLLLMERGIKFARVLAQIDAPQDMIDACIASEGKTYGPDKCYAVNEPMKQWIIDNILESDDADSLVTPFSVAIDVEDLETGLPDKDAAIPNIENKALSAEHKNIQESDIGDLVKKHGFFETKHNPEGKFANYLAVTVKFHFHKFLVIDR